MHSVCKLAITIAVLVALIVLALGWAVGVFVEWCRQADAATEEWIRALDGEE